MIYQDKHTNLPMSLLKIKIRQGGWHEYNYYFGMGYDNSILFPNIHGSHDRNFPQSHNRMGTLHCKTYHHWHLAICRPSWTENSRCLSPVFPGCFLGNERVVETFDDSAGQAVLPNRCNTQRLGRHPVSSQRPKSQRGRMVVRCCPFDRHKDSPRLGSESGGSYAESKSALGWRTTWPANQHEIAPKEWFVPDRTGRRNVDRSCLVAASKAVYQPFGRFLRFSGRTGYTQYTYNLSYASGCEYLRFASKEKKEAKRQTSQKRQKAFFSAKSGQKNTQLAIGRNLRTRQVQKTAGICQKSRLVQSLAKAGAFGYKSRPDRQREGRFFLYHRHNSHRSRSHWRFCGTMEHRGYFQKHQAAYRWSATSNLETQRPRTSGSFEPVALFCDLAVVSSAKIEAETLFCSALVSGQVCSELCGCVELPSPCALAG